MPMEGCRGYTSSLELPVVAVVEEEAEEAVLAPAVAEDAEAEAAVAWGAAEARDVADADAIADPWSPCVKMQTEMMQFRTCSPPVFHAPVIMLKQVTGNPGRSNIILMVI